MPINGSSFPLASGNILSSGGLTVKLAKEFGFCYGVERAIDLAYAARKSFPPEKRIFLLGEIIHNPEVNDQIRNLGIRTISNKPTVEEMAMLQSDDVVIIPAGTGHWFSSIDGAIDYEVMRVDPRKLLSLK